MGWESGNNPRRRKEGGNEEKPGQSATARPGPRPPPSSFMVTQAHDLVRPLEDPTGKTMKNAVPFVSNFGTAGELSDSRSH